MDPPLPAEIRARSELLADKYPVAVPPANPDPLQVYIDDAVALVSSLTARILTVDPTSCVAEVPCEETPDGLRPVALRAVSLMSERLGVQGEIKIARSRARGQMLRSFTAGRYCVPMETEALTSRGWRNYGDLCVGDLLLGFDTEAGVARWTPITDIVAPFEADLVRLGGKRWSVRCTPDHRWLVRERGDVGSARYVPGKWGFQRARDLADRSSWYDILTAAPAMTEHRLNVTPAEAALVGWLWTDGHIERRAEDPPAIKRRLRTKCAYCGAAISRGRRGGPRQFCDACYPLRRRQTRQVAIRGKIHQQHYPEKVEGVLATAEAPYSVLRSQGKPNVYGLSSPWLRDLWERAELDRLTPVEFVLSLGAEAREAFLEAGMWAEGHLSRQSARRPTRGEVPGQWYRWQFSQNRGPVLDAFVLATHLSGYSARVWKTRGRCSGFLCGRPHRTGQRVSVVPDGRELVWCVQTELGSWTMRQGSVITMTGNSESYFGPGELVGTKGQTRPRMDSDAALDAALWALATPAMREQFIGEATGVWSPASVTAEVDWGGWPGSY